MNEEQNIPLENSKEHPDSYRDTNPNGENEKHFPEDSHAPQPQISQAGRQASNIEPQTENMEVHHHGHVHEKNKWKEYIFQFFMLFLAVFCGFLAEYQLEHVIEHNREKQYMETLLDDLKKDTADLQHDIRFWNMQIARMDTMRAELRKKPEEMRIALLNRLAATMTRNNNFLYSNRTIEQLKHAGNFRLIRKRMVADLLIEYDALVLSTVRDIEKNGSEIFLRLNFLQSELFKVELSKARQERQFPDIADLTKKQTNEASLHDAPKLFTYYNTLQFHELYAGDRIYFYRELVLKAINIINLLKKEYLLQ